MAWSFLTSFCKFLFLSERIDSSILSDIDQKICSVECEEDRRKDNRKNGPKRGE